MVLLHNLRKKRAMSLIALGAVLMGIGFGLLPLGRSFLFAAFTVAVWTMGEILIMPLTATVVSNRADGASAGRYLGLLSFAFSLSMLIAPLVGNWLLASAGGTVLWVIMGGACALTGAGFWIMRKRM
jgi:MFS family permease